MPVSAFAHIQARRGWAGFMFFSVLLSFSACGDSVTQPPTVARVVVSPGTDTITSIGGSAQYTARVEREDGTVITSVSVTWSVADASVASVHPASGLTTGLARGTTSIRANAQGVTGSASVVVHPRPEWMGIVTGDNQVGPPGEPLTIRPEVEVRDQGGTPIGAVEVTFSVTEGGGSAGGVSVTDDSGRASTTWVLGAPGPQRLLAQVGGEISVEFLASADPSITVILDPALRNAHVSVPYHTLFQAQGGTGPYSWTVSEGGLPAGLQLAEDGRLTGAAREVGLFSFTVRAHPANGVDGYRNLQLRVCPPPPEMAVGSVTSIEPPAPGGCGLFLGGGDARRYRLAILRIDLGPKPDPGNVETASLTTILHSSVPSPTPAATTAMGATWSRIPEKGVVEQGAHQKGHLDVRSDERRLIERHGTRLRVLPSSRPRLHGAPVVPAKFRYDPPQDLSTCIDHADRTAVLIAHNQRIAVYQDSIQSAALPVSETAAQKLLDFYATYGHQTLVDYTGGLPDVNGDGILVVLATPEGPGNEAAMVWSGDLFDAQTCPGSNQMEVAYFDTRLINRLDEQDGDFRAASTLVHEAKHVASFYHRLRNYARTGVENPYHPAWIEEGTAEIVAEAASRMAWAAAGGPPVDHRVIKQDLEGGPSLENSQVFMSLQRASRYLGRQPNAVTVAPAGSDQTFGIYGSGWIFHRFIADAHYGSDGESSFFKAQNDSLTQAGIAGLESLTGKSFQTLLEAFAGGLMLNGTGTPTVTPGFVTYDFESAMLDLAGGIGGVYPWAVTGGTGIPVAFSTHTFSGPIGETGIRIHDFVSEGTETGIEIHVDVPSLAKLVAIRLR